MPDESMALGTVRGAHRRPLALGYTNAAVVAILPERYGRGGFEPPDESMALSPRSFGFSKLQTVEGRYCSPGPQFHLPLLGNGYGRRSSRVRFTLAAVDPRRTTVLQSPRSNQVVRNLQPPNDALQLPGENQMLSYGVVCARS